APPAIAPTSTPRGPRRIASRGQRTASNEASAPDANPPLMIAIPMVRLMARRASQLRPAQYQTSTRRMRSAPSRAAAGRLVIGSGAPPPLQRPDADPEPPRGTREIAALDRDDVADQLVD